MMPLAFGPPTGQPAPPIAQPPSAQGGGGSHPSPAQEPLELVGRVQQPLPNFHWPHKHAAMRADGEEMRGVGGDMGNGHDDKDFDFDRILKRVCQGLRPGSNQIGWAAEWRGWEAIMCEWAEDLKQ